MLDSDSAMAEKKCLYKKNDLDDDDDYSTSRLCFQVSSDVKLKEVPCNGEEYLLKVIHERANYAPVLLCEFETLKKMRAESDALFAQQAVEPVTHPALKPTIEWQNMQVADFSDVRMNIQRKLDKGLVPPAIKHIISNTHRVKDWRPLIEKEEPTMTHVVGLSQSVIDVGFNLLIDKINTIKSGSTIDHKTGQWIYSLLAVTKYPHLSDTSAILRDLAKTCIKVRSKLNPEDENAQELAAPMNLFICLVAKYFGQKDLAD